MFNNDIVYEKYISADGKSALILAGFNEERLDYRNIHREIMKIKQKVEDENTVLYASGEPVLKGWVWFHTGELAMIFSATAIFVFVTLVVYFRRLYGWTLPVVGTCVQAIWGLGFTALLGYNLDPLILVIPLLISARAASHAVQMIERYFEELETTGDRHTAIERAFTELIIPGAIGVLADAAGILVLSVATIPLIRKLAFFGAFWGFSNIFTILMLIPLLLSVLPTPRAHQALRAAMDGRVSSRRRGILHASDISLGHRRGDGRHRGSSAYSRPCTSRSGRPRPALRFSGRTRISTSPPATSTPTSPARTSS